VKLNKPNLIKTIASATAHVLIDKIKEDRGNEHILQQYQALLKSRNQNENPRFDEEQHTFYPCVGDDTSTTDFEPHYTYHPAWAARILAKTLPKKHIDIASTLKFCTIVSAFIPIEFYDYRPAALQLDGLTCKKANLLNLPFEDASIESLSCMHTLEHIGLGRYGDEIDYDGDLKAIKELQRVLAPNGNLLVVVPIGKPKIEFNAHRIYAYAQIRSYFKNLNLVEFSLVPDDYKAGMITNATEAMADEQHWGCGCFWFKNG
jgi:SAM-dependent methyltransferase